MWIFEYVGIHVTCPCVQEDCRSFGDDHSFVFDVSLRSAGKGETENGEVTENFSCEGGDVWDTSFFSGICPDFYISIFIWKTTRDIIIICLLDFLPSGFLNIGASTEESNCPSQSCGDRVKTARQHSQGNTNQFLLRQLGFGILKNIALNTWTIGTGVNPVLQFGIQSAQIDVSSCTHLRRLCGILVKRQISQNRNIIL